MMMDRLAALVSRVTAWHVALAELVVATGTIAAAWMIEWAGYPPCDLCLRERKAYYAAIPLCALLVWLISTRGRQGFALAGFVALALIFVANSIFGIYHAGVEWGWFVGPTECTGAYTQASDVNEFMRQLEKVQVVRCDAPALRIFGLSLAGWNAIVSAGLAGLAAFAGCRLYYGSSSVSQYK
jgi:disulfide bond formation protein DsbB